MSKQKEITGPGITSVFVAGLLTFLLGGALAIASLVSRDVPVITREPKPDAFEEGEVYFFRGERIGRTAWRAKEDAWKAGMVDVLRLSETELNQWSQERLETEEAKSPEGDAQELGFFEKLGLRVQPVNFKIYDDYIQMATEVAFKGFLEDRTFIYQTSGGFESTPGGIRFVPKKGNLGAAPLGSVPVAREWLYGYMLERFEEGTDLDWMESALEEVGAIEFADGQIILRRYTEG